MADVVFHSSGTTGAPKEIIRTEASLEADAQAIVAAFPEVWQSHPRVVSSARPDHLLGDLWAVRATRIAGACPQPVGACPHPTRACPQPAAGACPQGVISVEELAEACEGGAGNCVFVTTPSFLAKAVSHPDFASLRGKISSIIVSGGELRAEIAKTVAASTGVCPLEIYGSTEAGTVAWRRQTRGGEAFTLQRGVEATVNADGALVVDSPYAMTRPLVMSDAVAFVAPRQFVLRGRLDRRVKVLEEFVSLPEVEAAFAAHPLVAAARAELCEDDVPRLGALVVLTPEGAERLAGGTYAALAAALRRDLLPKLGERAFPRRIRFVRELPSDGRGKTTAAAVRDVLKAWCREPATLAWSATAERIEATLAFPPDCECFDGHFPKAPILPGVAQLFFVRHFARQAFADFPDDATYRRVKFQRLVRPNERIALSVAREADGKFSFSLSVAGERAASGLVERRIEE